MREAGVLLAQLFAVPGAGEHPGRNPVELPLNENFQIEMHPPLLAKLAGVKLVFITQPNAPSGVWSQRVELQRVIEETKGVVVIDEAYVDFASENCLDLRERVRQRDRRADIFEGIFIRGHARRLGGSVRAN